MDFNGILFFVLCILKTFAVILVGHLISANKVFS